MGMEISLAKTGCNGYSYKLEPIETTAEDHNLFQSFNMIDEGIVLAMKDAYAYQLDGMTIDFVKEGFSEHFAFNNPNTKGECGCGSSVNFQ